MEAIQRAVATVDGGQTELSRRVGVSLQAVNQWVTGRRPVPAKRVIAIEAITGVSRHDLRPDVFGPPPSDQPEAA